MSKKSTRKSRRFVYANQHAAIETRPNMDAQIGGASFTARRDDDLEALIFTDSSNTTSFNLDLGSSSVRLTGRQARTIQRLLNKHYSQCGVATLPGSESF